MSVIVGRWAPAIRSALLAAYGEWHYGRWLRQKHFARLVPSLPCDLRGAEVLDAGCGRGAAALWLARRYPGARVSGIDADAAEVKRCRQEAADRGIPNARFAVGRLEDLADDRRYDFIYSIAVLEYIDRPADTLARFHRALRPGGILLLDVRDRGIGANPAFGLRRFAHGGHDLPGAMHRGFALSGLHDLMEESGLRVGGVRHAIAPPAALAHTVFELLRERRLRWYFAVLPLLRAVGYTDFLWRWRRGGSLMMWARRDDR